MLARVLRKSGSYRSLFELLAFTGLRIGEALGLTCPDVDLDAGLLSVHRQLSRYLFVSRQLGPADPAVTLSVYAHLYALAKHALAARSALEASYAATALLRS